LKYLLDTNACIALLNGRIRAVYHMLTQTPTSEVALCAVVKAELLYGASKSHSPDQSRRTLYWFF